MFLQLIKIYFTFFAVKIDFCASRLRLSPCARIGWLASLAANRAVTTGLHGVFSEHSFYSPGVALRWHSTGATRHLVGLAGADRIFDVIDEEADSDVMIDNENDPVTTMYVNGNEGILVEYPDVLGLYYLVWQDSYYQYSLYGSFSSVAELMKIAEGIKAE